MVWKVALALAAIGALAELGDQWARNAVFLAAQGQAREMGKPLLVVGVPKGRHTCGDVCLDLNPYVLHECQGRGIVGDVTKMDMFRNKEFGAVVASHVLEHLASPQEVAVAVQELDRVADSVYILTPWVLNPLAALHPGHKVRVWRDAQGVWWAG